MMAPRRPSKRPRSRTENGESVEDSSAGGRRSSGKRPRLSPTSEDEDSESTMASASETVRPCKEKPLNKDEEWERARDGNFEDLQYQEEDDQHATQIVERRYKLAKERLEAGKLNDPADVGIIEEVKCQNFMCHERLTVKLGPLINFIIGHNGSGKSAVLTAITLCLGGKATATNRGQNLKSFIKEGENAATLTVRLKNQGSAAYKPELYGKSIIVERHFTKAGANSYKIKSANDRIVSTKKSDLDDILDAFSLQLDNPMNVLTQDMARQFLNHSGPKEKYKFFLKGTQLEALDHDYRLLQDTIDTIESKYEVLAETTSFRKKAHDAAAAKKKQSEQLDTMQERIEQLRRKLAWAQVAEEEKRLSQIDTVIETLDKKIDERKEESEAASVKYDIADHAHDAAKASLTALQEKLVPIQAQCTTAKEKRDKIKEEGNDIVMQQRDMNDEINNLKATIQDYTTKLAEERRRQEQANGGQHAQKLVEIQEAKAQATQARVSLESHRDTQTAISRDLDKAEKDLQNIKPAIRQKQEQIRNCQNQMRNIQSGQGNWSAGYHNNLSKLLRAIENERRFRETPVGPMGRHVRLLKPEWSSILEKQAGQSLNSFVVTNKADESILSNLMKQTGYTAGILIAGSTRPLDTSNKEPSPELETWMRVLKFDNDLVRNQMIIGQAIDQTVLFKDRSTAFEFISGDVAPQFCRQVFAMAENVRGAGHLYQRTAGGAPKMGPIKPYNGRARMQTDHEAQLSFQKETLTQLQQDFRDSQAEERRLAEKMEQCKKAVASYRTAEKDLKVKLQRADELADRLTDELTAETPQIGQIESFENIILEKEAEKEMQEAALQDAQEARAKWAPTLRTAKNELRVLEEEVNEVEAQINKATAKTSKLRQERESALMQKNEAIETLKFAEREKEGVIADRQEQATTVANFIRGASEVSLRVPVDANETYDSLQKKWERLKKDKEISEARLGASREELVDAEMHAKVALQAAKNTEKSNLDVVGVLKDSLVDRKDRWSKFRRWIQSSARITFTYLLTERRFRGSLEISPAHKFLDIKVEPDITKTNDKGRQTKTLSGGEKSFSTICLLLALWDAMGSPIRCLDEFDVFMDSVNRDVSMGMMIAAARRSVGRQYILITPQAMGSVSMQEDVRIIKMTDPVRGQSKLPFAD